MTKYKNRDNAYTLRSRVRFSEVDHEQKMTLPAIINYFQDCSTFQSEDMGVGLEYCQAQGRAWILSYWQIFVERYPKLGEQIAVSTWSIGIDKFLGYRNFCMTDETGEIVACAYSVWVYMDIRRGRPVKVRPEDAALYGNGQPLDLKYEDRKVAIPETLHGAEAFAVKRSEIDTNEHVNNCQYVQMALEVLPKGTTFHELRVEYKKSAVYGDKIYPEIAVEADKTVVVLADQDKKPYAVVEFK